MEKCGKLKETMFQCCGFFLIGRKRNNVSPFVTIWFVLSDHLYMNIHFDTNRAMLDSGGLYGGLFQT